MNIYDSRASFVADTAAITGTAVLVLGFASGGDAPPTNYKRLASAPSPVKPWHVNTTGGGSNVWWQHAGDRVSPQQLSAVGALDDFTALFNADAAATALGVPLYIDRVHVIGSNLDFTAPVILGPNARLAPKAFVSVNFIKMMTTPVNVVMAPDEAFVYDVSASNSKITVTGACTYTTPEQWGCKGDTKLAATNVYASGTDDTARFTRMLECCDGAVIRLTPGKLYGVNTVFPNTTIRTSITLDGQGGKSGLAFIGPASEALGVASNILQLTSGNITCLGIVFKAPISVVLATPPGCGALLRFDRLSGKPVNIGWRNIVVRDCVFEGGQNGIGAQTLQDSYFTGNTFRYQFQRGLAASVSLKRVAITNNNFHRAGANEGITLGSSLGGSVQELTVAQNVFNYCGMLDPNATQEGLDLYFFEARDVRISDNIAIGCGAGFTEMKWSPDTTNLGDKLVKDFRITNNENISWWGAKMLSCRLASTVTTANPVERILIGNNAAKHQEYAYSVAGASVTFATTLGSTSVSATISGYAGKVGDTIVLRDCTLAAGLGGIPLHELTDPRQITSVSGAQVFFDCETAANSVASSTMPGANCKIYIFCPNGRALATNPITITAGSFDATITDLGSNMPVGSFVTLSGVPAGLAGLPSAVWNRKFEVKSATGGNSYVVRLSAAATSTLSPGGGAGVVAFTEQVLQGADYWLGQVDGIQFDGNSSQGGAVSMQIDDGTFTSGDLTTSDLSILNHKCLGSQYGLTAFRSTFQRLKIKGGIWSCWKQIIVQGAGTGFTPVFVDSIIDGNVFEIQGSEGGGVPIGLQLTSNKNMLITNNSFRGMANALSQYDAAAGLPASSGNRFVRNTIDFTNDPDLTARDAVVIGEGAWEVAENTMRLSASFRGVVINGGTVTAFDNNRGAASSIPTWAGAVGDGVTNAAPTGTQPPARWRCTTAGAAGAAAWKIEGVLT